MSRASVLRRPPSSTRRDRAFAGESKYSLKSLFKFSINTILCFSDLPLKLGIYSGVITALFGLIMVIYTVYTWKIYGAPNGYATIVVLISFMFSVLFVIVGIIGEYIAILFAEIKDRPVYIVKDTANVKKNPKQRYRWTGCPVGSMHGK